MQIKQATDYLSVKSVFTYASADKNKKMEYVLSIVRLPQNVLKEAFAFLGRFVEHIYDHFVPHARNNYRPHILGHRALALFSGLLVAVKIFTLAVVSFGPVLPAFSSAITGENIINLTNQSRSQFSLSSLKENSSLDKSAQAKADDMLAKGYFAHNSPDGHTPWDFFVNVGYNYLMAGENLAVNFSDAENVESAWMNSPGHKANILNKNFEEIGIGVAQGEYQGHTAIFVVQHFGTPVEQKVVLKDKPTQVQAAAVPPPAQVQPAKVQSPAPPSAPVKSLTSTAANQAMASQPQTLGDNQNQAPPVPAPPAPVSVQHGDVKLLSDTVNITAETSGPAAKVIAYFGEAAIMLSPKNQNTWSGEVPAKVLAQSSVTVRLKVLGMQGQSDQLQLADFSGSTIDNYNLAGTTPASYASFLGHTYNPKAFESKFYLFFIAGLLSSLVLAIGLKRHIQHLSLIANSSFVIIFASLLWMAS